jgi:hypothetical protein
MSECEQAQAESYFLSYSRSDGGFAMRLAKDIRAAGVSIWVDQLDIRPSEHWDRAIERAVRCCRGLVVILSPRAVASENVADEISFAINSGKSVLPVMIERCDLPLRITRMHLIDATESYEKALEQCLNELKRADGAPMPRVEAEVPTAPAPIDPEIVANAKRQLAPILGPIAAIVVDREAARAASTNEFHTRLLAHIEDEADRHRFLAATGKAKPQAASKAPKPVAFNSAPKEPLTIPEAELDSIATVLTRYLGPIAPIVAKRESRASTSLDDFRHRLAALITSQDDQAEFLRRTDIKIEMHQAPRSPA